MTRVDTSAFAVAWQDWHDQREADLRLPHGWLSLTAFHWLDAEPAALDGLPGLWRSAGGAATVTAREEDGLTVDGELIDGTVALDPDPAGPPHWIGFGDKQIEIAKRGRRHAVRVRDPEAPTRTAFTGVPVFAPDPGWVVPARFTPFAAPEAVIVGAARADLKHTLSTVGVVHFELGGEPHDLLATDADGGLGLLFRDLTSGISTAAWRQLTTAPPRPDGTVMLDFNRAVNLPCVFTEFGTCPLPPGPNLINAAVTAGERAPR